MVTTDMAEAVKGAGIINRSHGCNGMRLSSVSLCRFWKTVR